MLVLNKSRRHKYDTITNESDMYDYNGYDLWLVGRLCISYGRLVQICYDTIGEKYMRAVWSPVGLLIIA